MCVTKLIAPTFFFGKPKKKTKQQPQQHRTKNRFFQTLKHSKQKQQQYLNINLFQQAENKREGEKEGEWKRERGEEVLQGRKKNPNTFAHPSVPPNKFLTPP